MFYLNGVLEVVVLSFDWNFVIGSLKWVNFEVFEICIGCEFLVE